MTVRPRARLPQATAVVAVCALLSLLAVRLLGQSPGASLTLLSKDQRRAIPLVTAGAQELVALDDLASAFQLTVREESGALTVSFRGRTILLTTDQALASVAGRLVSLPAPPTRSGGRWLVPVEFISRALALVYDQRLDLRRGSRLLVIGDMRVPRVAIRYEPLAGASRVTIDATPKTANTVTQDGARILVRFDADAIDASVPAFQPQGFVSAIRLADAVTVAVELGPRFGAFRASSEAIEDTTRIVLDIAGAAANTTAAPGVRGGAAPGAPIAGGAVPGAPVPGAVPGGAPGGAAPAAPGAPVPVAPPTPEPPPIVTQPIAIRTIAVDAGHGGDDIGVKGAGGTMEKDITLALARRVKAAVEGRLGIRVLLTRDEDRSVALDDRVAIANNSKADLFITLHANASLRGTVSGASIYVAALGSGPGAALAPERLPTLSGGTRDIELVEWDRAQLRFIGASTELAGMLRTAFDGRVPLDDHQALTAAPFRVLESANMPAVLIEAGFLSNPDQERQLAGAEFQTGFAQSVVDAVVRFRDYLVQAQGEGR